MPSSVSLVCSNPACKRPFEKAVGEYNRRKRLKQKDFYCSPKCAVIISNKKAPRRGKLANFGETRGRHPDKHSPFRWFLLRARQRAYKKGTTNLTLEFLEKLWKDQGGICALTGWQLLLPDTTNGWRDGRNPKNASLDRIDNNLGYVEGNVRFVALAANMARGQFSDEELRQFCQAVIGAT